MAINLVYGTRTFKVTDPDPDRLEVQLIQVMREGGVLWITTEGKEKIGLGFPFAGPVVLVPDTGKPWATPAIE